MTISGIMPLRNAVKLGYPFELAIRSLRPLCDELVILVDPLSEDDTLKRVYALAPDKVIESVWDMTNHKGHTNCEITVRTEVACSAAGGDWIMSLQADEILHEDEVPTLKNEVRLCDNIGVTGISLRRLYFYGSLDKVRLDWTQWLVRLFKRGHWKPDVDGAMKFEPLSGGLDRGSDACIYHYSRIGDPRTIAQRVANLDGFFHEPDQIRDRSDIDAYDFSTLRKLDTYVKDAKIEIDANASLGAFPIDRHPKGVRELFE